MRRLTNINLPRSCGSENKQDSWTVICQDDGLIISVEPDFSGSAIDDENWYGDWLSPRGIDLQINGGLGVSFSNLDFPQLPKLIELLDQLWRDGIEAICPTFISCPPKSLRQGLKVLREARKYPSFDRCKLLGAHLEGPFLSKSYLGAHDFNSIIQPSLKTLNDLIQGFEDELALVTIAPELVGSFDVISYLQKLGIVVSLGHSSADAEISFESFNNGIEMITHSFNAMKGLHHRSIGPVGAAIIQGKVFMGLIADGVHIHRDMVKILYKLSPNQIVLISDVIAPYGLIDGHYNWDNRIVFVEKGECRLPDKTIAGSILPLLEACKNIAYWTGNPSFAIWSATIAPRKVLREDRQIQNLLVGKNLKDLLRWKMNSFNDRLSWQSAA